MSERGVMGSPVNPKLQRLTRLGDAILQAAPDPIIVCDTDGSIVLANRQAEQVFGYAPGELSGASVETLVPNASRDTHHHLRERYHDKPRVRPMGDGSQLTAQHRDGHLIPVEISLSPLSVEGTGMVIAILRDVSSQRALREQLEHQSTHDGLTGLFNRAFFDAELSRCESSRQYPISIVVSDVNDLKDVNDRHGHSAGDALIQAAAAIMRDSFRSEDVVARVGGDEFAVILMSAGPETANKSVERVRAALASHNASQPTHVSLAIGAATSNGDRTLAETLRTADTAMYADKRRIKAAR